MRNILLTTAFIIGAATMVNAQAAGQATIGKNGSPFGGSNTSIDYAGPMHRPAGFTVASSSNRVGAAVVRTAVQQRALSQQRAAVNASIAQINARISGARAARVNTTKAQIAGEYNGYGPDSPQWAAKEARINALTRYIQQQTVVRSKLTTRRDNLNRAISVSQRNTYETRRSLDNGFGR